MKTRNLLATAAAALVLLAACGPAPTPTPLPTPMPSATAIPPTATPAPTATAVPTPVATSPPTYTPTPAPTLPPTSTPRPTATSTPATDTYVIFTDDYSAACNLATVDDEEHTYKCENGEYTMLSKVAETTWWVYYREPYDDAVIEADARVPGGTADVEYGLTFRVSSDGNSLYLFDLTTDGHYSLYHYSTGSKWTPLAPYTASNAIKTGAEKNRLKVIAQGNQIALYVNDQFLETVTDSKLVTGNVGFTLGSQNANVKVAFDNLRVSKINRPFALPAPKQRPPTPTPLPTIPPGMGGLIVVNYYGQELNYEIGGKLYKIPANGRTIIYLPPGKQNYSADIPGRGRAGGTLEIELGTYTTQSWASK